ncbi:MAG: cytochrome c biogenesis protein [Flavobacteriales bacterium]|nr:cytochrome c biogenesis protein [Flavobacteriales bacterium]MCX7768613.1 cytochrome c biogenesis protein [Flavobacteriales bacterium]MDW8409734.1 cytochrome c biogenesis protein CcsA [Flavobacteriales bacterium]
MDPKNSWWKWLGFVLLLYAIPLSWIGKVSVQGMLHETIRNLYYHVSMWFAMLLLMLLAAYWSVKALATASLGHDLRAASFSSVAFVFGLAGVATGSLWARHTWGTYWTNDPKLNGAAGALLIYAAYFILRASIPEPLKRLKAAAVYNIFGFVMTVLLVGLLPRITRSLHPGNGGNPGFGTYDLAGHMRPVFYSMVLGFTALGAWIAQIKTRISAVEQKHLIT